ncbi:substrate-binding domain-containing protein [Microbacterium sp.]|uniref:substrate-binding domain-containing protein n=1 Tax=Microbacterium sp. TaxID=51671 RepID=UPI003A845213
MATAAGVSQATASKALNGRARVDARTRARVHQLAEELGYRPNVRAQRLRTGRSHAVALVTALPAEVVSAASELGFLLEISLPVAQACLQRGYSLMLVPPVSDLRALDALDVDGAVVLDPRVDDAIAARLQLRGVRVVTVGKASPSVSDGSLDRGPAGIDVMLRHLVERGARHVGVLLSTEPFSVTRGLLDYLEANADPGVRYTVLRASAAGGEDAGYVAVRAALEADPTLDAIYAPLDAFAVGAVRAADTLGLHVPDEVMVATNYDGRRALHCSPQLTALDLHLPEMGRGAVDLLFRALDGEDAPEAPAPAPTVIPRASTARTTP